MPETQINQRRLQKRAQLTFDRIKSSAEAIIVREGYVGLTMRRLAEESGVGIGTIYGHFDNRDHLIVQIYSERLNRKLSIMDSTLLAESAPSPDSALLSYFQAAIDQNAMSELDIALFTARQHTSAVNDIVADFEQGLYVRYVRFFERYASDVTPDDISATTRFNLILEHSLLQAETTATLEELAVFKRHHAGTLGYLLRALNVNISDQFEQKMCQIIGA